MSGQTFQHQASRPCERRKKQQEDSTFNQYTSVGGVAHPSPNLHHSPSRMETSHRRSEQTDGEIDGAQTIHRTPNEVSARTRWAQPPLC